MNAFILEYEEPVNVDTKRLALLYARLGESGAEVVVGQAMEGLAVDLARIRRQYLTGDFRAVSDSALAIATTARPVGMAKMAEVACAVADCSANQDMASLGATLARLVRIGDQSLSAVWDLQDLSG